MAGLRKRAAKKIERARKIAAIFPEAKDIARAGGLDNNQRALLAIAKESGKKAQVRKATELAGKAQELRQMTKGGSSALAQGKPKHHRGAEGPPVQPDLDRQAEQSDDAAERKSTSPQVPKETTLDELTEIWKRAGGPALWKYAPWSVRNDFKGVLDRALCAAKVDVLELIEKVFFGRKEVYAKQLYAYAKTRRISKNALRRDLKALGYKVKKCGPEPGAQWAYINKDSEWKGQLSVIKDAELKAPLAAKQELTKHDDLDWMDAVSTDRDYFADI